MERDFCIHRHLYTHMFTHTWENMFFAMELWTWLTSTNVCWIGANLCCSHSVFIFIIDHCSQELMFEHDHKGIDCYWPMAKLEGEGAPYKSAHSGQWGQSCRLAVERASSPPWTSPENTNCRAKKTLRPSWRLLVSPRLDAKVWMSWY